MKIIRVSKSTTYYVETDNPDFPDYRTDETGTHWENAMGDSWESVYGEERELQGIFLDYMKHNKVEGND
jgi:hypothetical protein